MSTLVRTKVKFQHNKKSTPTKILSKLKEQLNHYFCLARDDTQKVVYIAYYDPYIVLKMTATKAN